MRRGPATLRRLAAPAVSLVLIAAVVFTVDLGALGRSVRDVSLAGVALIAACLAGNLLIGSLRLRALTLYVGRVRIGLATAVRANVAGLLSSLLIFNIVGSIIGRHAVLRRAGLGAGALTGIVTLERVLLAGVAGALMAAGFVLLQGVSTLTAILAELALAEMLVAMLLAVALLFAIFGWRREIRWLTSLFSARAAGRFALVGGLTTCAHLLMIACYVVAAWSLGVDADWLHLAAAGAIVSFAAGLPISVNGWGVREVSAIYAFGRLGIPAEQALTLSIMIGLLSTIVVLLFGPTLMRVRNRAAGDAAAPPSTDAARAAASAGSSPALSPLQEADATRLFITLIAPLAALFVFFQVHVRFDGALLSLNLADPLALVALTLALMLLMFRQSAAYAPPRPVLLWLGGLSIMMVGGYLIGYWRLGPIDWALNNRLVGWPVILGYFSLGALLVGALGQRGLRRLAEVLICAGAATAAVSLLHVELAYNQNLLEPWMSNFEGFARNRNTYAFQLLTAAAAAIAFSRTIARTGREWPFAILLGLVLFAIWRTHSKTGVMVEGALLVAAYVLAFSDRRVLIKAIVAAVTVYSLLWIYPILLQILTGDSALAAGENLKRFYVPSSQTERWMTIMRGLELWRTHPIFGAGLGAFAHLDLGEAGGVLVIHSTPIWLLAEFGLVGLALVAGPPLFWIWSIWRGRRTNPRPYQALALALALCFGLFSLPHDIFYQRIFWLVLGAVAAAWGLQRRAQSASRA